MVLYKWWPRRDSKHSDLDTRSERLLAWWYTRWLFGRTQSSPCPLMHWGEPCRGHTRFTSAQVAVPNSQHISCLDGFFLECSLPAREARVWSPTGTCQSRDLKISIEMTLVMVLYSAFFITVFTQSIFSNICEVKINVLGQILFTQSPCISVQDYPKNVETLELLKVKIDSTQLLAHIWGVSITIFYPIFKLRYYPFLKHGYKKNTSIG